MTYEKHFTCFSSTLFLSFLPFPFSNNEYKNLNKKIDTLAASHLPLQLIHYLQSANYTHYPSSVFVTHGGLHLSLSRVTVPR
jgi:hypothetical protein